MTEYQLKFSRFKGVEIRTISFPKQGTLMLSGKSGIGKSTILEALSFALYDDMKNSCYPRSERGSKKKVEPTSVQLSFPNNGIAPNLVIFRQRRPNLLKVTGPTVDLIDEPAQKYLIEIFGPAGCWFSGGYLRQDKLCAFLTMNSTEKLSFLQELSLPGQFEALFEKVTGKIQQQQHQLTQISAQTRIYGEMYLSKYALLPEAFRQIPIWNRSTLLDLARKFGRELPRNSDDLNESPNLLLSQLNLVSSFAQTYYFEQINEKLKQLQAEQLLQSDLTSKHQLRTQLITQLAQFESQLKEIPICEDLIRQCEQEINELNTQIQQLTLSERKSYLLAAEIEFSSQLQDLPTTNSIYTLGQLENISRIQSGPTVEQFEQLIFDIQEAQKYQLNNEKKTQYEQLRNNQADLMEKLKDCPDQFDSSILEKINQQIWSAQLHEKKLNCPHCSNECMYVHGKLEKFDQIHISPDKLAELKRQKAESEQEQIKYSQRKSLETQLTQITNSLSGYADLNFEENKVPPRLSSVTNLASLLDQAKSQLVARKDCPSIDCEENRKQIAGYQNFLRCSAELKKIQSELAAYSNIVSENNNSPGEKELVVQKLETQRNSKNNDLLKLRVQQNNRVILTSKIQQINQQCENLPERVPDLSLVTQYQNEFEAVRREQQQFEFDCAIQARLYELQGLYQSHANSQKQEQDISQKIGGFNKIRSVLITAEYVIIDLVLEKINQYLNEVLKLLFDEPITVMMRSLRQMKTSDRIKPEINLEINLDGDEFSSLSDISEGQMRRISLGLVIAFSQITRAPFLLLDESLASLDVENKEKAVSAIRQYTSQKLVIAVNHDTTEGVYDEIISLT